MIKTFTIFEIVSLFNYKYHFSFETHSASRCEPKLMRLDVDARAFSL